MRHDDESDAVSQRYFDYPRKRLTAQVGRELINKEIAGREIFVNRFSAGNEHERGVRSPWSIVRGVVRSGLLPTTDHGLRTTNYFFIGVLNLPFLIASTMRLAL